MTCVPSATDPWRSNFLRVVALARATASEEHTEAGPLCTLPPDDIVWTLLRQNQLMQDENRSLRNKVRSLNEENVWSASQIDRMHWEYQSMHLEAQWLWNQQMAVWNRPLAVNPEVGAKTYAQTLRMDDSKTDRELCTRHEPSKRREKRQCKCCVIETIQSLMMAAPQGTGDLGGFVACHLVNIPPFVNFWCSGCTREFVNQTTFHELEEILRLVVRIEHDGVPVSELKKALKHASLRQRVKCQLHYK